MVDEGLFQVERSLAQKLLLLAQRQKIAGAGTKLKVIDGAQQEIGRPGLQRLIAVTSILVDGHHHDWDILAYAVGYGGSMVWFGSSAGVAISNQYPEAKSVGGWIRWGWFVPIGFMVGFFIQFAIMGWNPTLR